MSDGIRISVALCTYNGARYLYEQLVSFVQQQRQPDELVVCDDGSTDATLKVLREFARSAPFAVHIHCNEANLGVTRNFERAIALCSGDVIAMSDQDDVWLPEKLARMEAAFEADPEIGLVICDAWLVGPDLAPSGQKAWVNLPFGPAMQRRFNLGRGPRQMLRYNLVTGAFCAFRAELREILLPIPTCWVHDGWIGIVATAVAPARAIPEPLVLYRQHGNQEIGLPRLTLMRQLSFALHRLDRAEYFQRLADCFEAVHERLREQRHRLLDSETVELAAEKARLARTQQVMRGSGRGRRVVLAFRELVTGRYHRFDRGFRSFAVDLLLR
jgi:glycosyltransferase involved in cell wall biosynthesis